MPKRAWTTSGAIHHSEASVPSSPMRSRKLAESRQRTEPMSGSWISSTSGPTSIQPTTAALMPPPSDVRISANTAAHHQPRQPPRQPRTDRTPWKTTSSSHGSAA